jgi:hypothetical protein
MFVLPLATDISDLEWKISVEAASITWNVLALGWEEMEYQNVSAV